MKEDEIFKTFGSRYYIKPVLEDEKTKTNISYIIVYNQDWNESCTIYNINFPNGLNIFEKYRGIEFYINKGYVESWFGRD